MIYLFIALLLMHYGTWFSNCLGSCGLCQRGLKISSIAGTEGWVDPKVIRSRARSPIVSCGAFGVRGMHRLLRDGRSQCLVLSLFFSDLYLSGWMLPLYFPLITCWDTWLLSFWCLVCLESVYMVYIFNFNKVLLLIKKKKKNQTYLI